MLTPVNAGTYAQGRPAYCVSCDTIMYREAYALFASTPKDLLDAAVGLD